VGQASPKCLVRIWAVSMLGSIIGPKPRTLSGSLLAWGPDSHQTRAILNDNGLIISKVLGQVGLVVSANMECGLNIRPDN
jgi:hypothetical protein